MIEFREGEGRNKKSINVTRDDLRVCFRDGVWLNDTVMVYRDMEWFIEMHMHISLIDINGDVIVDVSLVTGLILTMTSPITTLIM